mgnify:CR=1 FL=1
MLSAPGAFRVTVANAINNKTGLFFYGTAGRAALPFHAGVLCVQPPLRRTPAASSGGNPGPDDCSGSYAIDFKALAQSGADPQLSAGAVVRAQLWARDPAHPDGTGVGLTDAVEFELCP